MGCVALSLMFCTTGAGQYASSTRIDDSASDYYYTQPRDTAIPYGASTYASPPAGSYNPTGTFAQPASPSASPQPGGMEEAVFQNLPGGNADYVSPFTPPARNTSGTAPTATAPAATTPTMTAPAATMPTMAAPAASAPPVATRAPTVIYTGNPENANPPAAEMIIAPPENAPPQMPSDLLNSARTGNPGSRELTSPATDTLDLLGGDMPMMPLTNQPPGYGAEQMLRGGLQDDPELPNGGLVDGVGYADAPKSDIKAIITNSKTPLEGTQGREYEGRNVTEIQVVGNKRNSVEKIMQYIHTRPGHTFTAEGLEDDVRRLNRSRLFSDVKPHLLKTPDGVKIIYNFVERGLTRYLIFQGNENIRVATLEKECGLVVGKPATTYDVEEARKKLEMYYHSKGYAKCVIQTIQGHRTTDPGVIFQIHEGPKFQIWSTNFEGNKIATAARLRTIIQSKPGIFWIFQGELMEEVVQSDVRKLEDYYRRLGFFNARISRRVKRLDDNGWSEVTFVINEGPQYKIREIKYLGNDNFDATLLLQDMKVFEGKPFNKDRLDQSLAKVRRRYGKAGHVFVDVNAETRFLDEPGEVDIVFQIKEGKTYRIGRVNVLIEGDFPQTQVYTVLNRLSVKPGDIVNLAELKQSELRLGASQLFEATGEKRPKIVYSPPETLFEQQIAKQVGLSVSDPNAGHVSGNGNGSGNAGTSAGKASLGGAGSAALNGSGTEHTVHKAFKCTVMEPDPNFVLGKNEEYLDVTIYGTYAPNAAKSASPAEHTDAPKSSQIHDLQTGKRYRTFELESLDAADVIDEDTHLDGFVTMANDDPAYAAFPIRTRASRRSEAYEANYGNDLPAEAVRLQPIPTQTPQTDYTDSNSHYLRAAPVATGMVVRGNNPGAYDSDDDFYGLSQLAPPAETAPVNQRTGQLATGEPPAMPAMSSPRFGGTMQPPPSPSVNNTDISPYTPPIGDVPPPGYSLGNWQRQSIPITVEATETMTGRIMFQLGVSTDAGLVGSVVLDEQNFDITRWPTRWSDFPDGTAFRGAGQRFRIELQPGTQLQRYSVSFDEPYLFNSQIGLGTSAMYYDRYYRNWTETRIGGQISLSRALTHDLRAYVGFRGYSVEMYDLSSSAPQRMLDAEGFSGLYGFSVRAVLDRRDNYAFATEGYYFSAEFEQVVGTYVYPRVNFQFKKYWLLTERADMSGRHVLSLTSTFAWTGDNTPIYESYFAGGSSTIRGFRFRDASPRDNDMSVGGNFMILASLEYLFPITADDSIRGVIFCDTGTVEQSIDSWSDRYRVSIGAGLRISMPMLGPAPIALDFAVPLSRNPGDVSEIFSITMGLQR